jgi:DNA-binding response OmpR family regulator
MRALRDRFPDRLLFVTATVRRLPGLRGRVVEDEFAEMFSQSTHVVPGLTSDDVDSILADLGVSLTDSQPDICFELSGGHPGLLIAVAQALSGTDTEDLQTGLTRVSREPQPRAECLKIWNQLNEEERGWLATLVTQAESRLPAPQMGQLEALGLVHKGEIFSPVLAGFVGRRSRAPGVEDQGIHLDPDSGDVWVDGVRIPVLTDLEYRLMALLDERRDKVTDKYKIVTTVWGEDYLGDVDDARVEKLVSRLRGKIESDPSNPRYLVTLRGRGYKLLNRPKKS